MGLFKRLLFGLLGIVAVLAAVGMLLPRQVTVARSIQIDAAPEQIFPHVNSLKAGAAWSPWLGIDPNIKTDFLGPEAGVGAALVWSSDHPNVGNGRQEIVESDPLSRVVTALDFAEMGTAKASVLLDPAPGATNVTWTLDTDMGAGPVGRWMGLMMDTWVGADYETGLANLKTLVEGQ